VSDDDLIAVTDAGQLLHRANDVVLLNFGSGLLASLQERVSA
jgi:hypothetical protein